MAKMRPLTNASLDELWGAGPPAHPSQEQMLLDALRSVELDLTLAVGLPSYDLQPTLDRVRQVLGEGDWSPKSDAPIPDDIMAVADDLCPYGTANKSAIAQALLAERDKWRGRIAELERHLPGENYWTP